ncbi:MAG: phospho-sugar mutase [Flavobacteriales bacterium]|nr:phospho-sugar mutase [Flavobacteriales bacterium]
MTTLQKAQKWLSEPFDKDTQEKVQELISNNPTELEDSFYKDMEFGTGGMRGIMGVGTNRLNKYTLGRATQGLSDYLNEKFKGNSISVAIAHDVRNNSKEFAKIVADVFTANGIKVYLFEDYRPTPELSFAVRHLNCQAGIVLTASHNPPEYNGYKVYFDDGCQVVPPHDSNIINKVNSLDFYDIKYNGNDDLITYLGNDLDEEFIKASIKHGSLDAQYNKDLKIVFTSIHGTTNNIIPEVLHKSGFTQVSIVEEQAIPSGNFPTVKSPNPEEPEALAMAIEKADKIGADVVIGTDPDGDRLGIVARNNKGELQLLNGNQTNTLLTYYLLDYWKKNGKLKGNEFIGSTIVTSDIFFPLAKLFNVDCKVGLTGFKWIGKMIKDAEGKEKFICGGEESFGFMIDDFVRDKDSVTSTLLACEVFAHLKHQGKTAFDLLAEIYTQTDFYLENLLSVTKKGKDGLAEIKQLMVNYRNNPPKEFNGSKVVELNDYQESVSTNFLTGERTPITDIPKSDVLIFYTEDGSKIACRPSGTEPKIKYYFGVKSKLEDVSKFDDKYTELENRIEQLKKVFA